MKQPKVTTTPPPTPASAILRGPRYRYFSTTPTKVTLRMRDLQLPEKARAATYDSEQFVDLPCDDIFRSGPVPKIRLARLAELAPDCVTAADLPDEGIKVCSARLALAYALIEGRELLEEPPAPELLPVQVVEAFAPPTGVEKTANIVPPPKPAEPHEPNPPSPPDSEFRPRRSWLEAYRTRKQPSPDDANQSAPTKNPTPAPAESAAGPAPEVAPVAQIPEPPLDPAPEPAASAFVPPPAAATPEPPPPKLPEPRESAELPESTPSPLEEKKPFSLFPKFRRNEAVGPKPSVLIPRSRIEIPKPKRPFVPAAQAPVPPPVGETEAAVSQSQPSLPLVPELPALASIPPPALKITPEPAPAFEPTPAEPASAPVPLAEAPSSAPLAELPPSPPALTPPGVVSAPPAEPTPLVEEVLPPVEERPPAPPEAVLETPTALLVETEHLTKEQDRPEITEQDALQAIFLTEEFLSVDRVLELCGNLPGIRSCVLSSGANVIASHNAPDSVDVISLSAHALEMIKAMRASAAKMGIGAVPAVTVHSEKGPITFFHQDDLCLLVLHKDRGFIPGVREKLEQVVHELSEAKLPLRLGQGVDKKMLRS